MRIDSDGIRELEEKRGRQARLHDVLHACEGSPIHSGSIRCAYDDLCSTRREMVRLEVVRQIKLELLDCEQWMLLFEKELGALGLLIRDAEVTG